MSEKESNEHAWQYICDCGGPRMWGSSRAGVGVDKYSAGSVFGAHWVTFWISICDVRMVHGSKKELKNVKINPFFTRKCNFVLLSFSKTALKELFNELIFKIVISKQNGICP